MPWTQSRRTSFADCRRVSNVKAIEAEECMLPSDGFVLMDEQAGLCATRYLRNPRPNQGFPNGARVCQRRGEGHGRPVERKRCWGLVPQGERVGSFRSTVQHHAPRRAMLGLPRWLSSRLQQGQCLGAVQIRALGLQCGSDWFLEIVSPHSWLNKLGPRRAAGNAGQSAAASIPERSTRERPCTSFSMLVLNFAVCLGRGLLSTVST